MGEGSLRGWHNSEADGQGLLDARPALGFVLSGGNPADSEAQRTCPGLCFRCTDVAAGEGGLSWAKQGHGEMAEVTEGGSSDREGGEVLRTGVPCTGRVGRERRAEKSGLRPGQRFAVPAGSEKELQPCRQAATGPGFRGRSAGTDAGQRVEGAAEVRPGHAASVGQHHTRGRGRRGKAQTEPSGRDLSWSLRMCKRPPHHCARLQASLV